jgi:adenylate cyclase
LAPPPQLARKTVTVLFSDVSGFTALGERLDPESVHQVMGRFFTEMAESWSATGVSSRNSSATK